jgi:hypothetical protein
MVKPSPKPLRIFFFWSGIIATLSYRAVIVLTYFDPLWIKVAWYVGTIGFIVYFGHRYSIQKKNAELVEELELIKAVEDAKDINKEKTDALCYLVRTTLTSKSRWNSMFIFITSILALIIGIILDLI